MDNLSKIMEYQKKVIQEILSRKKPLFQSSKKFQSMTTSALEGQFRQILNIPSLIEFFNTSEYANQYITYETQITGIYKKCQSMTPYGVPMTSDLVDKRVNLILSDGINIDAEDKKTYEWIDNWFKKNKLYGSKILKFIRTFEKEGRNLSLLIPKKDLEFVELKIKQYYYTKYQVRLKTDDEDYIEKVVFTDDKKKETEYTPNKFVYIHNGERIDKDPQITIGSILTQCDNIDRALYDLRKSNHLFGFPTPAFEAPDLQDVNKVKEAINNEEWEIGDTFVGRSKMYYPNPPDSAATIEKEISLNAKVISSRTGIPVHWIGWTDLMSNRATALELRDFITLATRSAKTMICEALEEAVKKAMTLSIDNGIDAKYDDQFSITIPDISIETIKQLSETWLPLQQANVISMSDMRNKIPGIDEAVTAREVDKEKKDNMATFNQNIKDMKENPNPDMEDQDDEEDTDASKQSS